MIILLVLEESAAGQRLRLLMRLAPVLWALATAGHALLGPDAKPWRAQVHAPPPMQSNDGALVRQQQPRDAGTWCVCRALWAKRRCGRRWAWGGCAPP